MYTLCTVHFHMSPQIPWINTDIITLVAFVGFFSTVYFQVPFLIPCNRGCIITELAFVWFISLICSFPWTFFIAFSFSWIILSKILIHHQNSTGGLLPKSGFKLRTNLLWIWRQIKESKIKIYLTICFSDQQNMSRRHRLTIKTCPMWRQSDWNGMIVGMRSVSAQWAGERWFIRQLPFSINPQ